jgi:DedD protein
MNDHNLDDLIIDNIEPKNNKTKSFLTIIALVIVVLIVAIILTKIILKDPNAEKLAFEENNTEMISPELTLQSATESRVEKEEAELSNILESTLKAPAPMEEIAKETVEITKETVVEESTKEEERLQKEKEYEEVRRARVEEERVEKEKAAQALASREKAEREKAAQEKVQPKVKSVPTPTIVKTQKKPAVKPVSVPVEPSSTTSQGYYIQVGSFTKTPSSRFLSIIKNSGFDYKITPKAANGTKKLLIGPYKNRASADAALIRVKDRINKNAFVVKK